MENTLHVQWKDFYLVNLINSGNYKIAFSLTFICNFLSFVSVQLSSNYQRFESEIADRRAADAAFR